MLDASAIKNDTALSKVIERLGFVGESANLGTRATFLYTTDSKEIMKVPCQLIGWEKNPSIRMQVVVSVEDDEFRVHWFDVQNMRFVFWKSVGRQVSEEGLHAAIIEAATPEEIMKKVPWYRY